MNILYSTDCPKCKILEKILNDNNVEYDVIKDENIMVEKGFTSVPILELDNNTMSFSEAVKYFNNKGDM